MYLTCFLLEFCRTWTLSILSISLLIFYKIDPLLPSILTTRKNKDVEGEKMIKELGDNEERKRFEREMEEHEDGEDLSPFF